MEAPRTVRGVEQHREARAGTPAGFSKFHYLGSSSNPDYNAESQPVGKTVEVQVVVANADGDQGPAGPAASVVVT